MKRTTLLAILILTVAIQASAITQRVSAQTRRPPRYSYITLSCTAAGYPAGWGSARTCTVYRPYISRRAPAQTRR